jgi:hypothetical protein
MFKFYSVVWLGWMLRMFFVSILLTSAVSLLVTLLLYIQQGMPPLNVEIYEALFAIFSFWFLLLLNISIPLALFINAKYLFNACVNDISLKLLSCPKDGDVEVIEHIGYGDLVQVWRKWLLLIVWNTAVLMLLSVAFSYLFTSYNSIFDWFSVYLLYFFILIAGFFSIILLTSRCKRVSIGAC